MTTLVLTVDLGSETQGNVVGVIFRRDEQLLW